MLPNAELDQYGALEVALLPNSMRLGIALATVPLEYCPASYLQMLFRTMRLVSTRYRGTTKYEV